MPTERSFITGSEKVPFTEEYFRGLLENGKVEFYAVWAEDELGGGDNGNEPDGNCRLQASVREVRGRGRERLR